MVTRPSFRPHLFRLPYRDRSLPVTHTDLYHPKLTTPHYLPVCLHFHTPSCDLLMLLRCSTTRYSNLPCVLVCEGGGREIHMVDEQLLPPHYLFTYWWVLVHSHTVCWNRGITVGGGPFYTHLRLCCSCLLPQTVSHCSYNVALEHSGVVGVENSLGRHQYCIRANIAPLLIAIVW